MENCPKCEGTTIIGVEYAYTCKQRYDGVSEWLCNDCQYRQGRWCEQELTGNEVERVYCDSSKLHPQEVELDD